MTRMGEDVWRAVAVASLSLNAVFLSMLALASWAVIRSRIARRIRLVSGAEESITTRSMKPPKCTSAPAWGKYACFLSHVNRPNRTAAAARSLV